MIDFARKVKMIISLQYFCKSTNFRCYKCLLIKNACCKPRTVIWRELQKSLIFKIEIGPETKTIKCLTAVIYFCDFVKNVKIGNINGTRTFVNLQQLYLALYTGFLKAIDNNSDFIM